MLPEGVVVRAGGTVFTGVCGVIENGGVVARQLAFERGQVEDRILVAGNASRCLVVLPSKAVDAPESTLLAVSLL